MKAVALFAFLSLAPLCFADGENVLNNEAMGHTPFERLAHAFHHGEAAHLGHFPRYDGSAPGMNTRNWVCINTVTKDTARSQIQVTDRFPYAVVGKVVTGSATPDNGPLFPAKPEQDEYRQAILWGSDGLRESQNDIGAYLATNKIVLTASDDELSETFGANNKFTWRHHDGLLIEQDAVVNEKGEIVDVTGYEYCWVKGAVEQPQPRPMPEPVPQPRRGD